LRKQIIGYENELSNKKNRENSSMFFAFMKKAKY